MTDHDTAEATAAFHHAVAGEFAALERNRSWRPGVRANATAAAVKRIDNAAATLGAALADNARKATQTAVRTIGELERRLDRAEAQNRELENAAKHLRGKIAVLDAEREQLRPKLANAESVRDALRDELTDARRMVQSLKDEVTVTRRAKSEAIKPELTELREQIANLQGQLAIERDHLCEPLPQRVGTANAVIREVLSGSAEPKIATPPPAAEPWNAPRTATGRTRKAAKPASGTGGGSARSKPAESSTEPPA